MSETGKLPALNSDVGPQRVFSVASQNRTWRCPKGHEWKAAATWSLVSLVGNGPEYTIGPDNEPNDYMPLAMVMSNDELRRRALNDALVDLRRMRQRYNHLRELEKVWDAVDSLVEQVA